MGRKLGFGVANAAANRRLCADCHWYQRCTATVNLAVADSGQLRDGVWLFFEHLNGYE